MQEDGEQRWEVSDFAVDLSRLAEVNVQIGSFKESSCADQQHSASSLLIIKVHSQYFFSINVSIAYRFDQKLEQAIYIYYKIKC